MLSSSSTLKTGAIFIVSSLFAILLIARGVLVGSNKNKLDAFS